MFKLTLAILSAALACVPSLALAKMQTVVLTVPTMDCSTCPITIKAALVQLPGVSKASVSYARREAVVTFDDARSTLADVKKATADAGYPSFVKGN